VRRLAVCLVHHPILDAQGAVVTTAITNLDVHDLARSARTYGASDYFLVHPVAAQRELVERILSHWRDGSSGKRIPDRKTALAIARVVPSLDEAIAALGARDEVELWITSARASSSAVPWADARARLAGDGKPILLVFGTGWGLAPSVIAAGDLQLAPIAALRGEYNHLSVRAACAIALDRLLGAG